MSEPLEPDQLRAVIRKSGELLAGVTGAGTTGGWDDLYTVLDFLALAFTRAYPGSPCQAGCSACCQDALFRVAELEWRAIEAYLATVPAAAMLAHQARAAFGPHREGYEALAAFWTATPLGESGAPAEGLPTRCPMLGADDRCTIYEVRPLTCRAYGHMGVTLDGTSTVLICREHGLPFLEELRTQRGPELVLAPCEPYFHQLMRLAPDMELAPLPLWLLRWADGFVTPPA